MPDATPQMTYDEWTAEARKRFGADHMAWRFVCPICKNIASVGDFKEFKDKGAKPNSAYQQCIGRYKGSKHKAFPTDGKRGSPCDYALYGLFRLPGVIVVMPDGEKIMAFAFAEAG